MLTPRARLLTHIVPPHPGEKKKWVPASYHAGKVKQTCLCRRSSIPRNKKLHCGVWPKRQKNRDGHFGPFMSFGFDFTLPFLWAVEGCRFTYIYIPPYLIYVIHCFDVCACLCAICCTSRIACVVQHVVCLWCILNSTNELVLINMSRIIAGHSQFSPLSVCPNIQKHFYSE